MSNHKVLMDLANFISSAVLEYQKLNNLDCKIDLATRDEEELTIRVNLSGSELDA